MFDDILHPPVVLLACSLLLHQLQIMAATAKKTAQVEKETNNLLRSFAQARQTSLDKRIDAMVTKFRSNPGLAFTLDALLEDESFEALIDGRLGPEDFDATGREPTGREPKGKGKGKSLKIRVTWKKWKDLEKAEALNFVREVVQLIWPEVFETFTIGVDDIDLAKKLRVTLHEDEDSLLPAAWYPEIQTTLEFSAACKLRWIALGKPFEGFQKDPYVINIRM